MREGSPIPEASETKLRPPTQLWVFDQRTEAAQKSSGWSGTFSLPRQLCLGEDNRLRMRPVKELKQLRTNRRHIEHLAVTPDGATENALKLLA